MTKFQCHTCNIWLPSLLAYADHVKRHLKNKQIPCPSCCLVFTSRTSFYNHFEIHREEDVKSTPKVALNCSHCQVVFDNITTFKKHVKKLYPQTKVDCPSCHASKFGSFDAFRMHWQRNHQQRQKVQDLKREDKMQTKSLLVEVDVPGLDCSNENYELESHSTSENLGVHEMRHKLSTKMAAEFLKIQVLHGVPQEAMNKLVDVFSEAAHESEEFMISAIKNKLNNLDEQLTLDVATKASEGNVLGHILTNNWLSTFKKRDVINKKNFCFLDIKMVLLGHNATGEMRHFAYISPKEALQRFFNDKTAAQSFWNHHKSLQTQEVGIFGDFFTSEKFRDIQNTLTVGERHACDGIPLCLGTYR